MIVERLEVRGGFLDGLDLSFATGLNVLIGSRGAGKTSVLELIRFALGVRAMTADAQAAADRQARAVLGDGTVSVYCSVHGRPVVLTRSSLDDPPAANDVAQLDVPLVCLLEIETIGLDPASRRGILDALVDLTGDTDGPWTRRERRSDASSDESRASVRPRRYRRASTCDDNLAGVWKLRRNRSQRLKMPTALGVTKAIASKADELGHARSTSDAFRLTE